MECCIGGGGTEDRERGRGAVKPLWDVMVSAQIPGNGLGTFGVNWTVGRPSEFAPRCKIILLSLGNFLSSSKPLTQLLIRGN